jgi:hypothetical protein
MGKLVYACDRIREEFGCTTLLLTHTGHENADRPRAHSSLGGAIDVSVRTRRTKPLEVRLECAEMRDFEEFEPRIIRLIPTADSLVAAGGQTRPDTVEQDVRAYLADQPRASQNEVEQHVTGKGSAVRAAYRRCKHVTSSLHNAQQTARLLGASHGGDEPQAAPEAASHEVRPGASQAGTHLGAGASQVGVSVRDTPPGAAPTNPSGHDGWTDPVDHDLDRAKDDDLEDGGW